MCVCARIGDEGKSRPLVSDLVTNSLRPSRHVDDAPSATISPRLPPPAVERERCS